MPEKTKIKKKEKKQKESKTKKKQKKDLKEISKELKENILEIKNDSEQTKKLGNKKYDFLKKTSVQEAIPSSNLQFLVQSKPSKPNLEIVAQEKPVFFQTQNMEEELNSKKLSYDLTKDYVDKKDYELGSDYKHDSRTKQEESSMRSPERNTLSSKYLSSAEMQKVGRNTSPIKHKFDFQSSSEEYKSSQPEFLSVGKSKKFQGEETAFLEDLERRYEGMK